MTERKKSHRLIRGRSLSRRKPKAIKTPLKLLTSGHPTMILGLRIPFRGLALNFKIGLSAGCVRKRGAAVADRRWPAWGAAMAAVLVAWFAIQAQNPPDALAGPRRRRTSLPRGAPRNTSKRSRAPRIRWARQNRSECARRSCAASKRSDSRPRFNRRTDEKPPMPQNVLARIKGQGPPGKKALMLCAHYDSVHEGPGASDNAAGVAVVLETLRALKAGPPLERDVIALFTDGEECGLLGSRLFVNEHPWAKEVGIVLNFDARGNSGPSIMFETSDGNGWLISQYCTGRCPTARHLAQHGRLQDPAQ